MDKPWKKFILQLWFKQLIWRSLWPLNWHRRQKRKICLYIYCPLSPNDPHWAPPIPPWAPLSPSDSPLSPNDPSRGHAEPHWASLSHNESHWPPLSSGDSPLSPTDPSVNPTDPQWIIMTPCLTTKMPIGSQITLR